MDTFLLACLIAVAIWFGVAYFLRGPDCRQWDRVDEGSIERFVSTDEEGHRVAVARLQSLLVPAMGVPARQRLQILRQGMDKLFDDRRFAVSFVSVIAGSVPAEWVLPPAADTGRRLLYIHGGAFSMGSPLSHRVITAKFAEISGGAVLAIDYRLMPEHSRMAGVEDCRTAYRWMLDHGPQGPQESAPASAVFVAGDSAGGNLTLSLIAWVRDQGLRAPNAAVALSPATDGTLGSPSLRSNVATDAMLGPLFGPLAKVPRAVLLWGSWLGHRIRPNNPVVSPLFGDLSNLPPVLIHASDLEMLLDDSVRYTNKARAAGSPVTLQTWNHMVHVWHLFDPDLTEARQGFEEIGKFLESHATRG